MTLALITGGSGLVGSNLTRALLDDGYKVRCLDFDKDHRAFEGLDVELVDGDITKENTLEKAFSGVDIVFHTAALINLDRRYRDLIRLVNVQGTRNVCEAALNSSAKKMIHFSSVDAFYRFPIEEPLYEDRKLIDDPNAMPYDLSKADGNRVVLDYCSKGLDASIIHPTSIVGPNDFKIGILMHELIKIANGKRRVIPDFGYNFIDARDLSRTAISAIEHGKAGQNYLVGGEYCMFLKISEFISEQLGRKTVLATVPDFVTYLPLPFEYIKSLIKKEPRVITLDSIHTGQTGNYFIPSTLAREELGHISRPIKETVNDTIDFFVNRGLIK